MFFRSIILSLTIATLASAYPAPPFFPQGTAREAAQLTLRNLESCGLVLMNAWDPRLPRPMVPADVAIVTKSGGLLAYYREEWWGDQARLEFKNPNGSFNHHARYNQEYVSFVTPYGGNVAHANRAMTVTGPFYQLYCRSWPTANLAQFHQCIRHDFINVITHQLCRFGALR